MLNCQAVDAIFGMLFSFHLLLVFGETPFNHRSTAFRIKSIRRYFDRPTVLQNMRRWNERFCGGDVLIVSRDVSKNWWSGCPLWNRELHELHDFLANYVALLWYIRLILASFFVVRTMFVASLNAPFETDWMCWTLLGDHTRKIQNAKKANNIRWEKVKAIRLQMKVFYVNAYLIKVRHILISQCWSVCCVFFPLSPSQSSVDDKNNWCLFYALLLACLYPVAMKISTTRCVLFLRSFWFVAVENDAYTGARANTIQSQINHREFHSIGQTDVRPSQMWLVSWVFIKRHENNIQLMFVLASKL